MRNLRAFVKSLTEQSLVALGGPRLVRVLRSERDVVLAYHNVIPDGSPPGGDRSLHLSRADFARQMDLLDETCDVVDLNTLIQTRRDLGGRPLAAVTFDDGYRGALTVGVDELEARGMPCTVFVPPGLLGIDAPWWDALASEDGTGLAPKLRDGALDRAKGRSDDVFRWAEERGVPAHDQPRHAGLVDEGELAAVVERGGVTVGAHGWTHADLTRVETDELRFELGRPLKWLQARFGDAVIPWVSVPYGRWSDDVVDMALDVGYEGVIDLSGKLVERRDLAENRRLHRKNIPAGISPEGYLLRLAGL